MTIPARPDAQLGQRVASRGAAADIARQPLAVQGDDPAGDEGAHAVPQQKIGLVRIPALHLPPEKQLVLGHMLPAVGFAEIAQILRLLRGAAVAQVIVPAHHEAAIAQGPGKPVVPADVLHHAVADLDHRPGLALRWLPDGGVEGMDAVRPGERPVLFHAVGHAVRSFSLHVLCSI